MPKPSSFMRKMQAQGDKARLIQRRFTIQQMEDVALITLKQEFGFGEKRILRYRDALRKTYKELCADAVKDAEADEHIVYTKAKMDDALRPILGEAFQPWEERYNGLL